MFGGLLAIFAIMLTSPNNWSVVVAERRLISGDGHLAGPAIGSRLAASLPYPGQLQASGRGSGWAARKS